MPLARPVLLLFAMLDDHDAFLAGLVDHPRVTHLADQNDIAELQEAIGGMLEMGAVANVGVHPDHEAGRINLHAEVDYVPAEVARIDLGRVDLNNGDVLSESEGTNTELERRSKGDVAEDALRWFGHFELTSLWKAPRLFFAVSQRRLASVRSSSTSSPSLPSITWRRNIERWWSAQGLACRKERVGDL